MRSRRLMALAAVVATALVAAAAAVADPPVSPLANPGFESGDLSGWNADSWGAGAWGATSTGTSECEGPTNAPWEGTYAGLWDMDSPSGALLTQSFTVPASESIGFAFAYANWAGGWVQDETDPYDLGTSNEWLRIDVIESSADTDTLDPGDIVATAFDSQAGNPDLFQGWKEVSVPLTGRAGDTLTLRVVTVNTENCMPVWLDALKASQQRAGYCAVAGNTTPAGAAIAPGTFLDLAAGQPASDSHYTGALTAYFYEGLGISCDALPGYTKTGEMVGSGGHGDPGGYVFMKKN